MYSENLDKACKDLELAKADFDQANVQISKVYEKFYIAQEVLYQMQCKYMKIKELTITDNLSTIANN